MHGDPFIRGLQKLVPRQNVKEVMMNASKRVPNVLQTPLVPNHLPTSLWQEIACLAPKICRGKRTCMSIVKLCAAVTIVCKFFLFEVEVKFQNIQLNLSLCSSVIDLSLPTFTTIQATIDFEKFYHDPNRYLSSH
jgi:hypothetical protein